MENDQQQNSSHLSSQKIDAKLRMYANCDQEVNENRAVQNANLTVAKKIKFEPDQLAFVNDLKFPKRSKALRKKKLQRPSKKIITNVFIELSPEASRTKKKFKGEIVRKGNLIASQVALTDLKAISEKDEVVGIEMPRVLKLADPIIKSAYSDSPIPKKFPDLGLKYPANNEVLIGIIDVAGFDFSHPDFLDKNGQTRFLKIWDQGSDFRKSPKGFNYGAEFLQTHLNTAIKKSRSVGVPATELERQSSRSIGSHGTHVTSIAAGNSGVFPSAKIIGVTIALKRSDLDRRKSFYDSACLVHALNYLLKTAQSMDMPISINISLGTNGHAHDGSDITSRWIDSELNIPGRCVCIAAGNAGQEKALSDDDFGFTMGRIHAKGKIEATGLTKDIYWTVVGNGISDASENEMEIWYAAQDRMSIMIKPPGLSWIGPVKPNQYIENRQLDDGSFISVYNELYHFSNGSNYIGIYLSPNFKDQANKIPIRSGLWQVRLYGEEIRHGEFHGWIERDDPRRIGAFGNKELWNFPSFLSESSNVDNTSISSLACARYVIAVGNCDTSLEKVNISSSQGPTRDGRNKPEVLAPGTDITAAKGFTNDENDQWISMTGTSMASPYVCGVAAWMLAIDKKLSASQIQGIMIRTSKPLPGEDYKWRDTSGFGIVDVQACLDEAKTIREKKDIT
jgi:subtilisin family serine protease